MSRKAGKVTPPRRCPHTGSPLVFHDPPGPDFGVSEEGAVYYLKARSLNYGSDYFLEEYKKQYGRSYLEDGPALRAMARRRLEKMKQFAPPPARLLEIGCAAGFFLDEARRLGYHSLGIDVSEYAIRHARDALGLDARCASFPDFEPEERFDAATAFYVIEHFEDQRAIFSKIAAILKPGGIFCFALPSTDGPLFRTDPQKWRSTHPPDHFADYSPASLRRILPLYGMRLVSVRPASYHPERVRGRFPWARVPGLYRLRANAFNFGDTIEGIAVKDDRLRRS